MVGDRYVLRTTIGSGGMGTVWKSYDQLLRREVAIKEVVIPAAMAPADRDVLIERTLREARAAAGLNHPSVVRMFDVVTEGGRPWLVMELLAARSVAEIVADDGALSPRATAKIGLAMLGALEAAHAAGILHRDVKPANVLICGDGRCVLTDFGVARLARETDLTTPGMVLGSPHYIAPERAMGEAFGPPSDLFSLGVTLYTAVEGSPPFDRADPIETMHAVVRDAPERPRNAGPLAPILHGLLEKNPRRRWDIARTRAALRELLDGALARTHPRGEETDPHAVIRTIPPRQPAAPPTGVVGGRAMLAPDETPAQRHARSAQVPQSAPSTPPMQSPPAYGTSSYATSPASPTPAYGTPPALAYSAPLTPVPPVSPKPARRRPRWLLPAGIAAAALVLLGGVVLLAGWFSAWRAVAQEDVAANPSGPPSVFRTFQDKRGFSVNVPREWVDKPTATYIDIVEPGDTGRRIRLNVEAGTNAHRWAEIAAGNLKKSTTCQNFTQLGITDLTVAQTPAAELRYTCGTGATLRHGSWYGVVSDGKVYTFYLVVPEPRVDESAPIHSELVGSFQFTQS